MNVLWGKDIAGRVNGHCSDFGLSMLRKGGRREIRERAEGPYHVGAVGPQRGCRYCCEGDGKMFRCCEPRSDVSSVGF